MNVVAQAESTADASGSSQAASEDVEDVKRAKVVEGHLVYRGEIQVGRDQPTSVCEQASFALPVPEDPENAAEGLAGDYDGLFPETTEHDICSNVKLKGSMKQRWGGRTGVKARLAASGHLVVESIPDSEQALFEVPEGQDLFARECRAGGRPAHPNLRFRGQLTRSETAA